MTAVERSGRRVLDQRALLRWASQFAARPHTNHCQPPIQITAGREGTAERAISPSPSDGGEEDDDLASSGAEERLKKVKEGRRRTERLAVKQKLKDG